MRFKAFFLICLFSLPLYGESSPVGARFRPSFLKDFFEALTSRSEGIPFRGEWKETPFEGHLSGKVSTLNRWLSLDNPRRLAVELSSEDLAFELNVASSKTKLRITWPTGQWRISMDLESGRINFSPPERPAMIVMEGPGTEFINEVLATPVLRESLLHAVSDLASNEASRIWIQLFRKNIFMERVIDLFPELPIWKGRTLVNQGAVRLDVEPPSEKQVNLSFAFFPQAEDFIFSSPQSLDLFLRAAFFSDADLRALLPESKRNLNNDGTFEEARKLLLAQPAKSEKEFARPLLLPTNAPLSLIIPLSLVNAALQKVYQDGLFRFRATIRLGETAKGLITKESQEVEIVLAIRPDSAPSLSFAASDLQVNVSDYVMDLNTYIEDRLIPTESLKASARVATQAGVDRNIYLSLRPETFDLTLETLNSRLSKSDLNLIKDLASSLWKDFLKEYSRLELFPAIIETGRLPLQIGKIYTSGDYLIFDARLDWEGVKWN